MTPKELYVECRPCGERWAVATLPTSLTALQRVVKTLRCPNCEETRRIGMCATEGRHAVTSPRKGNSTKDKP